MIDSMLPCGDRSCNLYIGRAPGGRRRVINIPPGTLQGSAGVAKDSRAAPMDTVRCPVYLFTKIGKKSRSGRPVPGRVPYATLRVLNGLYTGCRFDENDGIIWSSLFDAPASVRVVRIVLAPVKSEGSRSGTVRKMQKYLCLLNVGGVGVIRESPFTRLLQNTALI